MKEKNKSSKRSEEEKNYLTNRLSTIEGQVRGIVGMIEKERYCGDILVQISAIDSSLKSLGQRILKSHLSNCLADDLKKNNEETINELIDLFQRLK